MSNLGPGFDILGMAIDAWPETVEAFMTGREEGRVVACWHPESVWHGAQIPSENASVVAAEVVRDILGVSTGMTLQIKKSIRPGSGLGSSASGAVAGAVAANAFLEGGLSRSELVEACLEGEFRASGARHGDNVIPTLFGGLTASRSDHPEQFVSIPVPEGLFMAVVLPDIQMLTAPAREALPPSISLHAASSQASSMILLLDAFRRGDWPAVGEFVMSDQVIEPIRARNLPVYEAVRAAAMGAGAHGVALSGSGPAMFAISSETSTAQTVLEAGLSACLAHGTSAQGRVVQVQRDGARVLSNG